MCSGVEMFFATEENERDPRSHKYALLHLFSGVLLILKERLIRAHTSLVFERVEEVGSSTAKTVRFDQLLRRLEVCAGVKLEVRELEILNRAQLLRNAVEHYKFEFNLQASQKLITQLVEFAYLFARRELGVKLEEHLSADIAQRISELRAILSDRERERTEDWNRRARRYRHMGRKYLARVNFGEGLGRHISKIGCSRCKKVEVVVPERDITVCLNCRDIRLLQGCMLCGCPASEEGLCEECLDDIAQEERSHDRYRDEW